MAGGRPMSEDTLYARSLGITGLRAGQVIRRLGGAEKLRSLSPEARAILLSPLGYGNSRAVGRVGLGKLGLLRVKDKAMNTQSSLFDERPAPTVGTLNAIVLGIMADGKWMMPWQLCDIILRDHKLMISDASVGARLRDLRKVKYGSHSVEKKEAENIITRRRECRNTMYSDRNLLPNILW